LVRQDDDSLNAASKFRSTAQVLQTTRGSSLEEIQNIIRLCGNIRNQMRVFLSEARAQAHWVSNVKGLDDDQLQTS
jgi:hypothetical protein